MLERKPASAEKRRLTKLVLLLALISVLAYGCGSSSPKEQAFDISKDTYGYKNPVEVGRSEVSVDLGLMGCSEDDDLVLSIQDEGVNAHTLIVCFNGNTATSYNETNG